MLPAGRCLDVQAPPAGRLVLRRAVVSDYSARVVTIHGIARNRPMNRGLARLLWPRLVAAIRNARKVEPVES